MRTDSPGRTLLSVTLLSAALLAGCRSSPVSPSEPTNGPAYVVKIALIGLDPTSIDVPVGARVTFVNNDGNFAHHMGSACQELDAVGRLEPGQSGQTSPFTGSKTCTYFDRLRPDNPLRHGKIVVR